MCRVVLETVDRMYHNIPRFLKAITQKVTLNLSKSFFKSSELAQIEIQLNISF